MHSVVILSHPSLERSRTHRALYEAIGGIAPVEVRHLESLYPGGGIEVAAEQARLEWAQRVVFQFPLYWYSSPPMLKRWMDEVLAFGWAYGPGGTHLAGKTLQLVISAGAPVREYRSDGYNLFTIDELLRPFEVTARLTGMAYARPLVLYGAPNVPGMSAPPVAPGALNHFITTYRTLLER
jgi:putative NADPH-quinone reductase